MEDDDEFGDLYTDVLRPFTTSSQSLQQQNYGILAATTKTPSFQSSRPIDLNNNIDSDDDEILHGASNSNSSPNFHNNNDTQQQTLAVSQPELENQPITKGLVSDPVLNREVEKIEGLAEPGARVLDEIDDKKSQLVFGGSNLMDEGDLNFVVEENEDKDENFKVDNLPIIPGLSSSIPGISEEKQNRGDENFDEEFDSDSEDDLQILLNDNELGPMGMARMEEDEDDEDGEPLIIVADDNNNLGHPPLMEEQEWGEEAIGDHERKEMGDLAKVNGGVPLPYNTQPYHHPFHSQFKYVRPGVTPSNPTQVQVQVRPPLSVGPTAGRGRGGDWKPPPAGRGGGGNSAFAVPTWGTNNTSTRGLDFTLPSHKTIFEVDIDSFEEKPWTLANIDISDFFNFGMNEETWKEYCKQLEQHRIETTMQSKIRVYESGRTEQEYDPDLPPELLAASGIQHITSDNVNIVKIEPGQTGQTSQTGQTDLSRGLVRARPQLPIGRPIQVETNYTERLPSIDTRQPRIRDSDSIIEIICHNDEENDTVKTQDNEESEDVSEDKQGYNSQRKREVIETVRDDDVAEGDEISHRGTPKSSEVPEERGLKGKLRERSPKVSTSESRRDNERESCESIEGKVSLSDEFTEADKRVKLEEDENIMPCLKKQKLSPENDGFEETKGVKSGENSKEGKRLSGREFRDEDYIRRKESDKYRTRKGWDPHSGNYNRALDRRSDSNMERGGSRHHQSERGKRDENESWRGNNGNNNNKEIVVSKHRGDREGSLKGRGDNIINSSKRRKEDELLKRVKTERENSTSHHRKRERERDDNIPDERRRENRRAHEEENNMKSVGPGKRRDDHHKGAREDVPVWAHGKDERRGRNERTSTREDRFANEESSRGHEKKHKEVMRKGKESEDTRKNQGQINGTGSSKVKTEQNRNQKHTKHNEEVSVSVSVSVSSDDEKQTHSRRGRTKLERWASHKEGDFVKSSSSIQVVDPTTTTTKEREQPSKTTVDPTTTKEREPVVDPATTKERKDTTTEDVKHLDTVEKLKKRSERFKQPLTSEKETMMMTEKEERETMTHTQSETIRSERPARKRRWTNN